MRVCSYLQASSLGRLGSEALRSRNGARQPQVGLRMWVWGAVVGQGGGARSLLFPRLPLPPQAAAAAHSLSLFSLSKVGLNVLVQKANKFTPATRLLVQRFVPFPAVGKPCTARSFCARVHRNVWARGLLGSGELEGPSKPLLTLWWGEFCLGQLEENVCR